MAKKRRKRHRHPVAPPVHSAPESLHAPTAPRPPQPLASRPAGAEPPSVEEPVGQGFEPGVETAPPRPRPGTRQRPPRRRRRRSRRPYVIVGAIVLAILATIVVQQVLSRRAQAEFNRLASAAGCGELRVTSGSGAGEHLAAGERTTYDTSPPTHGPHDGRGRIPAGVHGEPFSDDPNAENSIYLAVHSLEHGYIIVWHDNLSDDERAALEREYRGERKVIVVPYPLLERDQKMALTAWGRLLVCERPDTHVVDAFIERFREARSAPEPTQA